VWIEQDRPASVGKKLGERKFVGGGAMTPQQDAGSESKDMLEVRIARKCSVDLLREQRLGKS